MTVLRNLEEMVVFRSQQCGQQNSQSGSPTGTIAEEAAGRGCQVTTVYKCVWGGEGGFELVGMQDSVVYEQQLGCVFCYQSLPAILYHCLAMAS